MPSPTGNPCLTRRPAFLCIQAKSRMAAVLAAGLMAAGLLSGCSVITTTVAVTGAAVGVATTAASVAVDGAVLVSKGVVKTGEVVVDAVKPGPPGQ